MAEGDPKRLQDEIEQLRAAVEAERQLRYHAENRLRQVNADFREFTSMVCHDLREPLRTVSSYCELIAARSRADDPDAKQFLTYILDGVDRMQAMLSGMVEYAGAEADKRHPVPIDMNAVFWEGARRASPDPARTETIFTHDPLPKIAADFDILTKVMRHLLDNGVKFNRQGDARVHVSSRREGADWVFSVKDNGPGIDPAHHQRIFGLFKRLHGRDYPGIGLGLPYCRKALDGYGGRIWVESAPGEGSTFFFTLPALD
jgi:light-regulated signal transduction histidine kinase (bacteriophytochrome)